MRFCCKRMEENCAVLAAGAGAPVVIKFRGGKDADLSRLLPSAKVWSSWSRAKGACLHCGTSLSQELAQALGRAADEVA